MLDWISLLVARRVTGALSANRELVKLSIIMVIQTDSTAVSGILFDNNQSKFAVLTSITQLSHTDSGISFNFINQPKTKQPAQNPSMDSSDAKKPSIAIKYFADAGESKKNTRMVAAEDNINPINCANLFGGPGTGLSGDPIAGTIIFVAMRPIGLRVGPVNTLAKNPYVINSSRNSFPVISNKITNIMTIAATALAA